MDHIGVTVIAGFLGSGKTTLLRRIVRDPEIGGQVAVIVNELGALGLDEDLIASERTTAALYVRPGDLSGTAHAMEDILADEATRSRLLTAAPAALAKYSWPRAARQTLALLERSG